MVTVTPSEAAGVEQFEKQGIAALNVKQVMTLLGVAKSTVHELLSSRQLPCFKVGRSTKIPVAGIKKFVAQQMAK